MTVVTGKLAQYITSNPPRSEWLLVLSPGVMLNCRGMQLFSDDDGREASGEVRAQDGKGYVHITSVVRPPPTPPLTPETFAEKEKELLIAVPQEFHGYFSQKAYEDGHSAGYEEILCCLMSMLDGFQTALDAYTKRIKSS